MMCHILPNYSFERGDNKSHRKNLFFEVLAHCALTSSSVYGGGETFEWSKCSDEAPPSGRTYFDHIQSLSPAQMLEMFDEAIESQFNAASKLDLYDQALPIAIDTTTWESDAFGKRVTFESISNPEDDEWSKAKRNETYKAIEKWDLQPLVGRDSEKIRNADFDDPELVEIAESIPDVVRYVHGTKSGDDFCYAWEFAAACIAHPTCPMVFAVKPLERKDELEEHVSEFIERAQELIVVDEVYMDSAYAQVPVYNRFRYPGKFRTADVFDMDYVMNIRENDDVKKAVLKEKPGGGDFTAKMDDNDDDVTILQEYAQYSQDEKAYGHTTLFALPKRGVETVEDPVTDRVAFCTNRAGFDSERALELVNGNDADDIEDERGGYSWRWLIESGFKKVKEFLAYTKTGDADTRLFYMLYATLLFNTWMLVDRTVKKRKGIEYADDPELKAKTFAVIVANYLRPVT
ncbi:transposase [Haloterrigena alkaliphila]|uniref:Transposase n=1 Tax=Haloterrigena alkaliphila TaxID=2816475 RepID=A0A8A2VCN5_9EURY|nr:transposase [Haloterrigena alkaliphila]QSW99789.1 transposase [Haloterrigena alkaliphila]